MTLSSKGGRRSWSNSALRAVAETRARIYVTEAATDRARARAPPHRKPIARSLSSPSNCAIEAHSRGMGGARFERPRGRSAL